jgi:hypothetical protein
MAEAFAKDLQREKIVAEEMIAQSARHAALLEQIAETVFSRWASPVQGT